MDILLIIISLLLIFKVLQNKMKIKTKLENNLIDVKVEVKDFSTYENYNIEDMTKDITKPINRVEAIKSLRKDLRYCLSENICVKCGGKVSTYWKGNNTKYIYCETCKTILISEWVNWGDDEY